MRTVEHGPGTNTHRKILVIDSDAEVRRLLRKTLRSEHYHLQEAETGAEGIRRMKLEDPDVVLLDPLLPDVPEKDFESLIHQLRQAKSRLSILVMSPQASECDKIRALDSGADDFLGKPLSLGELTARIRAMFRRISRDTGETAPVFRSGNFELDSVKRRVLMNGREVHLTRTEYRLMQVMIRHADSVLTYDQLLAEVWGPNSGDQSHYIRVYMAQLRRKLEEDPAKPRLLRTVPGVGYRLSTS